MEVGVTPVGAKEALKVAQIAVDFLEIAPAKDRADAWKKCEAAWKIALDSTKADVVDPGTDLGAAVMPLDLLSVDPENQRASERCVDEDDICKHNLRYQFMETFLRVAEAKLLKPRKVESLGQAFNQLCSALDAEMTPLFEREKDFRAHLFTEEVDLVFKNNLNLLNAAYNIYAGITDAWRDTSDHRPPAWGPS
eukprot:s1869_g11.t1